MNAKRKKEQERPPAVTKPTDSEPEEEYIGEPKVQAQPEPKKKAAKEQAPKPKRE